MFFLIRPVGMRCQLQCGYCYYKEGHSTLRELSANSMQLSVVEALLRGLPNIAGEHTFCLHGGEPLLIGKHWFADFLDLVAEYNKSNRGQSSISVTVQSNALLVDAEWTQLFRKGQVSISVSLDGPAEIHDYARRNRFDGGTHRNVISSIKLLADNGIPVGCLAVITKKTQEISPKAFYEYFRNISLTSGLDVTPYIETGSTSTELAAVERLEAKPDTLSHYIRELFDLWLFDDESENKVDIRMFEQLVGTTLGFIPSVCNLTQGASCGRTPSVMPRGDIYACDLDIHGLDMRLGSIFTEPISAICSPERLLPLKKTISDGFKARGCDTCKLMSFCGLTCPRHTFSRRDHAPFCKLIEELVNHAKNRLNDVSTTVFREKINFSRLKIPFSSTVETDANDLS